MTILPPTVIHWVSPSVMSPPAALPAPRAEGRSGGRPTSARRFAAGAWTGCIVRVAPNGELVSNRLPGIPRSSEATAPPSSACRRPQAAPAWNVVGAAASPPMRWPPKPASACSRRSPTGPNGRVPSRLPPRRRSHPLDPAGGEPPARQADRPDPDGRRAGRQHLPPRRHAARGEVVDATVRAWQAVGRERVRGDRRAGSADGGAPGSLEARKDARRYFHGTYLRTTRAVGAELETGGFVDPPWVERWDVAFAGLYLDALEADQRGEVPSGPWKVAFAAADEQATALPPLRHVLLGMNAHINYDLPQALLEVIDDQEFQDPELLARRHGPDAYTVLLTELERLAARRVADLTEPGQVILKLAVKGFGVVLPGA